MFAPEAHEVLSKTPRIETPSRAKVCPDGFPIKASGNPEVGIKRRELSQFARAP